MIYSGIEQFSPLSFVYSGSCFQQFYYIYLWFTTNVNIVEMSSSNRSCYNEQNFPISSYLSRKVEYKNVLLPLDLIVTDITTFIVL